MAVVLVFLLVLVVIIESVASGSELKCYHFKASQCGKEKSVIDCYTNQEREILNVNLNLSDNKFRLGDTNYTRHTTGSFTVYRWISDKANFQVSYTCGMTTRLHETLTSQNCLQISHPDIHISCKKESIAECCPKIRKRIKNKFYIGQKFDYVIIGKFVNDDTCTKSTVTVIAVQSVIKEGKVPILNGTTITLWTKGSCTCPKTSKKKTYMILGHEDRTRNRLILNKRSVVITRRAMMKEILGWQIKSPESSKWSAKKTR